MPFEFPYTDFHEINLNKFVKAVKNLLGGHGGELLQKQSNIPFDYAWKPVTGLSAVNSVNGMTGNVTLTATDVGAIPNTTPIPEPANNLPADLGVPYRGTSLKYARMDHVHQMPTASDVGALPVGTTIPLPGLNAPQNLGTAYRGTATRYSREDHVHNMPSASDIGALPSGTTASDIGALPDTTKYAGSAVQAGPAKSTQAIPYGECDNTSTATAFTATIPEITEYKNGTCMLLKNGVVTSADGFTININGLGAKPSYNNMAAATADTTLFNINYTMLFIYDEDRVAGGCWICYRGYNSDTNTIGYLIRTNNQNMPMSGAMYRYRIMFTSADGKKYVPANTSTSTSATASKTVNQTPIDPFGTILYYSTTTAVSSGSRPGATYLHEQYNAVTLGYSFNRTGSALTLTSYNPVYVKATPQSDGSAIINSSTPYVQSLPTTDDGSIYIFLGIATSATTIEFMLNHPVYYFKNGQIRKWTNSDAIPMPTTANAGDFLVYNGSAWTAMALSVWQGGSY